MRSLPLLLTSLAFTLALAGCTSETATYRIDGADQTLSLRANQDYFWSDKLSVGLITARMPECQRRLDLGKVPKSEFDIEVFDSGDNVYTVRAGEKLLQFNIETCTSLGEPGDGVSGLPVGNFKFENKDLVFVKAVAAAAPAK